MDAQAHAFERLNERLSIARMILGDHEGSFWSIEDHPEYKPIQVEINRARELLKRARRRAIAVCEALDKAQASTGETT